MAQIIGGTQIAAELCIKVAADVAEFKAQYGITPTLAVILVGEDPASEVYVARKLAKSNDVGIKSATYRLPSDTSNTILLALIQLLNNERAVHGILVQLPLPPHIDASKVLDAIDPGKDVDGFHPVNVGRLSSGTGGLIPCTPLGCMLLLDGVIDDFRGKNAVVIGKSNIVGKPVALLLLERECTVTVTHILTQNLPSLTRNADILIAAAGSPRLVRGDWVKPGAIVIDVGITRVEMENGQTQLIGDCAMQEMDHAGAITPVPGGVGPMTIACLLSNTMKAARTFSEG